MIDLTQFTPWTLFTDLGFISILLLVGKFIRVKVKLIQQLFIPPSLIAGLLGLAFGPNGLGWIPLSNDLGTYAAILIALVFGALPLSSPERLHERSSETSRADVGVRSGGYVIAMGISRLVRIVRDQADLAGPE